MLHVNLLKWRNLIGSLSRDIGQYIPWLRSQTLDIVFIAKCLSFHDNKQGHFHGVLLYRLFCLYHSGIGMHGNLQSVVLESRHISIDLLGGLSETAQDALECIHPVAWISFPYRPPGDSSCPQSRWGSIWTILPRRICPEYTHSLSICRVLLSWVWTLLQCLSSRPCHKEDIWGNSEAVSAQSLCPQNKSCLKR